MPQILHRVGVRASPAKIYEALTTPEGLASWWTREVRAEPKVGANCAFTFRVKGGSHVTNMIVKELDRGETVAWECVGGPTEWLGTRVTFGLEPDGDRTMVRFEHSGWKGATDLFAHCSAKWAFYLFSLKSYLETGKGTPNPDDLDI